MGYLQGKLVISFLILEPSHFLTKYFHLFLLYFKAGIKGDHFFLYQGEYKNCIKGNQIYLALPFKFLCSFLHL